MINKMLISTFKESFKYIDNVSLYYELHKLKVHIWSIFVFYSIYLYYLKCQI